MSKNTRTYSVVSYIIFLRFVSVVFIWVRYFNALWTFVSMCEPLRKITSF